tara:strand:+ start:10560 stop:10784 length:225 start_codon:yes stop_codon:yes gene_type:complete
MVTWAKKKKDHHKEYTSYFSVVQISHEEGGYVYVCDTPTVIRDLKIRYGFKSCSAPQKQEEPQPESSEVTPVVE